MSERRSHRKAPLSAVARPSTRAASTELAPAVRASSTEPTFPSGQPKRGSPPTHSRSASDGLLARLQESRPRTPERPPRPTQPPIPDPGSRLRPYRVSPLHRPARPTTHPSPARPKPDISTLRRIGHFDFTLTTPPPQVDFPPLGIYDSGSVGRSPPPHCLGGEGPHAAADLQ